MAKGDSRIVQLIIGAKDQSARAFGAVHKGLDGLRARTVAVAGAITGAFAAITGGAFFKSAVTSAADFEQAMSRVAARLGTETGPEIDAVRAKAEELGATTKFTATEAAEGFEILAQAGISATDAIDLLPSVLNTAAAADLNLAQASDLVVTTLNNFGLSAQDGARAADVLAKGANLANTTISELGNAAGTLTTQAADMGLSLEQTVAMLDALAKAGIRSEKAGTALRGVLSKIESDGSTTQQVLRDLGISTDDVFEIFQQVQARGGRAVSDFLNSFDLEARNAARALVNFSGDAADFEQALLAAGGSSQQAASIIGNNLRGALTSLGSAWDAVQRAVINQPFLDTISSQVRELTSRLRDAATSQALTDFREALLSGFQQAAAGVQRFLASFDFSGVLTKVTAFGRQVVTATQGIATAFSATVETIRFGGNAIGAIFNTLAAGAGVLASTILTPFRVLADGLTSAIGLLNRFGLISQETFDSVAAGLGKFGEVQDAVNRQIVLDAHQARDAYGEVAQQIGLVTDETQKTGDAARDAAAAQTNAADATRLAAEAQRELTEEQRLTAEEQRLTAEEQQRAAEQQKRADAEAAAAQARQREEIAATRAAAEQLGVSYVAATNQATEGAGEAIGAFVRLAQSGQFSAQQISAAFANAVNTAESVQDVENFKAVLEGLAQSGTVSAQQLAAGLQAVNQKLTEVNETAATAIGGIIAAFDGSAESMNAVADQLDALTAKHREHAAAAKSGQAEVKQALDETSESSQILVGDLEGAIPLWDAMSSKAQQAIVDTGLFLGGVTKEAATASAGLQNLIDRFETLGAGSSKYYSAGETAFGAYVEQLRQVQRQLAEAEGIQQRLNAAQADGTLSMQDLNRWAGIAANQLGQLGDETLAPLRAALENARQELARMRQQTEDARLSLASLDAQIAEAKGLDERAAKLRREADLTRDLTELQRQRDEAERSGNTELVRLIDEQMRKRKELHRIQKQNLADTEKANEREKDHTDRIKDNLNDQIGQRREIAYLEEQVASRADTTAKALDRQAAAGESAQRAIQALGSSDIGQLQRSIDALVQALQDGIGRGAQQARADIQALDAVDLRNLRGELAGLTEALTTDLAAGVRDAVAEMGKLNSTLLSDLRREMSSLGRDLADTISDAQQQAAQQQTLLQQAAQHVRQQQQLAQQQGRSVDSITTVAEAMRITRAGAAIHNLFKFLADFDKRDNFGDYVDGIIRNAKVLNEELPEGTERKFEAFGQSLSFVTGDPDSLARFTERIRELGAAQQEIARNRVEARFATGVSGEDSAVVRELEAFAATMRDAIRDGLTSAELGALRQTAAAIAETFGDSSSRFRVVIDGDEFKFAQTPHSIDLMIQELRRQFLAPAESPTATDIGTAVAGALAGAPLVIQIDGEALTGSIVQRLRRDAGRAN